MGECGCGSDSPEYRIEGADGFHYGINIYTGCPYCHTPVALDIHRYNEEDAALFLDHVEPVVVQQYTDDPGSSGVTAFPILDPVHLVAALRALDSIDEGHGDPEFPLQVQYLDVEDVRRAMEEAIAKTQDEWRQM